MRAFEFLLAERYVDLLVSEKFKSYCGEEDLFVMVNWWYMISLVGTVVKILLSQLIIVQQVMEWYVMVYIIVTQ